MLRLIIATLGICCALSTTIVAPQPLAAQTTTLPWEVPPTTRVDAQSISFTSAGITLSGTLHAPRGIANAPLIIVYHGAAHSLRDTALYNHLIQMLPPLGIAVFVFDRRGSGQSGGAHTGSDYSLLADDGIAAAKYFTRDPRIDPRRIGFWGLSQGGWLALLSATRYPEAAFAISVSAPLTTPDVQMYAYVENILTIQGFSRQDIAEAVRLRKAIDAYFRGDAPRVTAQAALDAARDKPWFDLTYVNRTLGDPAKSAWPRDMKHDPMKVVEQVKVPALILFGARDPVIPTAISIERLQPILRTLPNLEAAVIAEADHSMATTMSPQDQIAPDRFDRQKPDAPEYFARLADWLTRQGLTTRSR